ncbi:MAG: hypothetical protein V4517_17325 [Pseudomonadota bacterium]
MKKKIRKTKRPSGGKRRSKPRAGLPNPASVVSETTLRSPTGRTYRVLRTTERDPYDPPDKPAPKRR